VFPSPWYVLEVFEETSPGILQRSRVVRRPTQSTRKSSGGSVVPCGSERTSLQGSFQSRWKVTPYFPMSCRLGQWVISIRNQAASWLQIRRCITTTLSRAPRRCARDRRLPLAMTMVVRAQGQMIERLRDNHHDTRLMQSRAIDFSYS